MGFIKELYSDNRAGLVVAFGRGKNSATYFEGDSISAAMEHFNIYLKGNNMYIKTEDEKAIEELGIQKEDAVEFRSTIDSIIVTLTDEQAIAAPVLFPIWQANVEYKVGDRIRYENKLYKAIQDHTSQIGWEPVLAPSLFAAMLVDEVNNTILEWVQPDSTNAYSLDDKVIHNDKFWISTSNNNVWEPGIEGTPWEEYIANWENGVAYAMNQKVILDGITYISLIEKNTSLVTDESSWRVYEEPVDEELIKEWVQTDSTNAYSVGDRVIFNGSIYESLIDNNVWSPAAYPAGWEQIKE